MAKRRLVTALKIIGVVLVVLVAIAVGLFIYAVHMAGKVWESMAASDDYAVSGDQLTEKAFKDASVATVRGMTLRLVRYRAHPFMAEYRMVIEVTAGNSRSSRELEPDSGGMSTVKLCNNTDGSLLLEDNASILEISSAGDIRKVEDTTSQVARCASPVGKFGYGDVGGYGFQPAAPDRP